MGLTFRMIEELVEAAEEAQSKAHAPYSGYKVGAAIHTLSGEVYTACNVEAKPSSNTLHAEARVIAKAVEDGHKDFTTLVLVTGGSKALPPCGNCRQALATFQEDLEIVVAKGEKRYYYDLDELLPDAYTGRSMEDAPTNG